MVEPLEKWIFSRDERSVEEHVLALARARGLTTRDGGVVHRRPRRGAADGLCPGSSESFVGGIVSYANAVKVAELDVPEALLAEHGAVSAEVAEAMAEGARRRLGADLAVAVTGVAGPDGGTAEKPVGLVHLHVSGPDGSRARTLDLPGEREVVRSRATVTALHLLRQFLEVGTNRMSSPLAWAAMNGSGSSLLCANRAGLACRSTVR